MPPIVSLGRRIDFLFNLCYGVKAFAAAVKNVDFMRVSEFVVITIRTKIYYQNLQISIVGGLLRIVVARAKRGS